MVSELRIIETGTCIRFVVRTDENTFIDIINDRGCWSSVGRFGGRQELSMDRTECLKPGVMMHQAMHALGFGHMHNSPDRDRFVQIMRANVVPQFLPHFDPDDARWFGFFNTPYDFWSVMHYARNAFAIAGLDSIVPFDLRFLNEIGQDIVSIGDRTRINRMYECRIFD